MGIKAPTAIRRFARTAGVVAGCFACGQAVPSDSEDLLDAVQVSGTSLFPPNLLNTPVAIVVGAGLVIVADRKNDTVVVVSDTSGHRFLRFGRAGAGPGEFEDADLVHAPDSSGRLWVHDAVLRRATRYRLSPRSRFGQGTAVVDSLIPLNAGGLLADLLREPGGAWIGSGLIPTESRFVRIVGSEVVPFGPPVSGDKRLPPHVRQHAYQSTIAIRPAGDLFAAGTRHSDRLDIYRVEDGALRGSADRILGFEPEFTVRGRGDRAALATDENLRFGYVNLAATDSFVYALYSGRRRRDAPGHANFGTHVMVLDWDGRSRAAYRLDREAIAIAVDNTTGVLFSVSHDPFPAVLRYRLPGGNQATGSAQRK